MKIHTIIALALFACLTHHATYSMERPIKKGKSDQQEMPMISRATPLDACTLLATPYDNVIGTIAQDISTVDASGYIGIESPHLTNALIIQELIKAAQRGARVRIFTDTESAEKNNLEAHFTGTQIAIKLVPELHAKRIVINAGAQKIVWLGSMNLSEHSRENHEIMMRCTDTNSFKESFGDQQRLGETYYHRSTPPVNFNSRRIINSSDPEAQAALNLVIQEFATCTHPHDYLYFVAYTLNDPEIIKNLISAKKNSNRPITVLLDSTNWINNRLHTNTVKPLVDAGVDVYIFNKNATQKTAFGHPKAMHIKAILRQCNQKCLSFISTANFTPKGKQEINHDLWEPCSLAFSGRLKKIIDTVIRESEKIEPSEFIRTQMPQEKTKRLVELMHSNAVYPNKSEILRLIQEGANPNAQANETTTLLMRAINGDQIEIAQALIKAGANVNHVTQGGFHTALIQATMQNRPQIVEILIKAGAELDYASPEGNTALYSAIKRDLTDIAKLLIAAGANVEKGGDFNKSRECYYGGTIPPIVKAARRRNIELVQALIDAGAYLDARDTDGFTALEYACKNKDISIIQALGRGKANLNLQDPRTGETPLIRAVEHDNYEVAKALLQAGANVNATDNEGKTATYYAARNPRMLKLLAIYQKR